MKKNLILCLLLFFYTAVLAHNAVPHGHFDEIFSSGHDSDSHDHDEDSNHDHHFLFSHSISLHVTIEKQLSSPSFQSKAVSKYFPNIVSFCLTPDKHQFSPPDSFWTQVYCTTHSPTTICSNTAFTRGPPLS